MKYSVIYADPPWAYRDTANAGQRGVAWKYPTMTDREIQLLPVQSLAAEDCTLFLWGTWPKIYEALFTIQAWGFVYKSLAFDWIKLTKHGKLHWGMGNGTRSNSEFVLRGIRGRPQRISAGVHSVVQAPVGEHSAKPDEVRARILQLMGDVPRIELFARTRAAGWHAWGPHAKLEDVRLKGGHFVRNT